MSIDHLQGTRLGRFAVCKAKYSDSNANKYGESLQTTLSVEELPLKEVQSSGMLLGTERIAHPYALEVKSNLCQTDESSAQSHHTLAKSTSCEETWTASGADLKSEMRAEGWGVKVECKESFDGSRNWNEDLEGFYDACEALDELQNDADGIVELEEDDMTESESFMTENEQPNCLVTISHSPKQLPEDRAKVSAWLNSLNLAKHSAAFEKAEIGLETIPHLSLEDLEQLGITAEASQRILSAAASQLKSGGPKKRQEFMVAGKGHCITDFFTAKSGQWLPQPGMPRKKPALSKKPRNNLFSNQKRRVPACQKVPGTTFVVDRFGSNLEETNTCRSWFLTHFHADHYAGLNSRFTAGLVYCTAVTARLICSRLKVAADRVRVIEMGKAVAVEGVSVLFLDANHCPGAAMILFHVPGRRPILHSGDCRVHRAMQLEPELAKLRGGGLDLYLDTTYCNPRYKFPSQAEVNSWLLNPWSQIHGKKVRESLSGSHHLIHIKNRLQALRLVLEAIRAEKYNEGRTLFLFGTYTIGKEKIFLEAAKALNKKVYVCKAKRNTLEALDLPKCFTDLLTDKFHEATFQAVPMSAINKKGLLRIAQSCGSRYTTLVGFAPTGWALKAGRKVLSRGRNRATLLVYNVPYSEHSSFDELREFVQWLQPANIVPTVGNDQGPKARAMVSLLTNLEKP